MGKEVKNTEFNPEERNNNVSNATKVLNEAKSESEKENKPDTRKKNAGIIVLCILAVIALVVGLISSNKMSEAEMDYALIQNTKTLDYSKEGEKINPIELVTIYRVIDNNQTESSSEKKQTDTGLIITCKPTSINTSKTGETKVMFTVKDKESKDATKTLFATFKVVDSSKSSNNTTTKKLVVSDTKIELKVGDKFDVKNVVSDAGNYKLVDKTPEKNDDGTYDTAWYTLTSNVDTSKAGTYEVAIHCVDKDGKTADKKVAVTVNEAKESDKKDDSSEKESNDSDSASSVDKSTLSGTNTQSSQNNEPAASKQPFGASSGNNNSAGSNNNAASTAPTCKKKQVQTKAAWSEQVLVSDAYDETVVDQEEYYDYIYEGTTTVCNGCGQEFSSYAEYQVHYKTIAGETGDWSHGSYHSYDTYTPVHHDAVTHIVHHDAVYTTVNHPAEYTEVCN